MQLFSRLMPREARFFELFNQHAALVVKGGTALAALLQSYDDATGRAGRIDQIGEIERAADRVTHETVALLHKTFVTPFDRDDIHRLRDALWRLAHHRDGLGPDNPGIR